jgi:streptogramin lyase
MPHTVQLDPKGRPWFSGNKNGSIGWLDPATGKTTVYKMPDPEAVDVHTITFDKKGLVYFTFQWANMVGRLNPDTGDIKLAKVAAERSQPYDIKFDQEGTLWVSCNARPCLLKVNPDTLDITEVKLPPGATTVRRFDVAPDGIIWYVNSGGGRLGRFQSQNRRCHRIRIAVRPALASVRHRRHGRRRVVQRIGHAARSARAFRHRNGEIPELGDQVRQRLCRHPAQRAQDPRRHAAYSPDCDQPHHRSDTAGARVAQR